ncbi:hypothetical protein PENSPDRAFT_511578 [Peniophora sp. CONT]|nr:hypothetical protein PENSPDRAFT_511578 [Peniophora sp. CONT]
MTRLSFSLLGDWSDASSLPVSHLQQITFVVKPMATLIITRRLYLIASLQSVDISSKAARRWNSIIEWTLGLFIPLLIAGPVYYVHQGVRFEVVEVYGCTNNVATSILSLLTIDSWSILPPLISVLFYYPKVVRMLYRQRRDIHSFLNSNTSVSRTNYLRILALASVDILLTLPLGIVNITLHIISSLSQRPIPFYGDWTSIHTDWEPVSFTYAELKAVGTVNLAQGYFNPWASTVLAFTIFGLLGLTSAARASCWRIICTLGGWVGWKPSSRKRNGRESPGEIEFGPRPLDMSPHGDAEMGRPSSEVTKTPVAKHDAETALGANDADCDSIGEILRSASNAEKILCP